MTTLHTSMSPTDPGDRDCPAPDDIRAQVQRIITSPEFEASEQLVRFLQYIVDETLAGRSRRIKQYTVAVAAFGRPSSFDPRADPIVRIEARRLRRSLARYYQVYGRHDALIIDVPTGGYVPTFALNKQVVSDNDETPPLPLARSEQRALTAPPRGPSIVVLPFDTEMGNEEQQYFAEGLAEHLVIALNRFPHLVIIGPLLPGRLPRELGDASALGRHYGAQFVLRGRIQKENDQVHIMVRLIDASTGALVWSDTYSGQAHADGLFRYGEEVTYRIAATLVDTYGVIPRTLIRRAARSTSSDFRVYDAVIQYSRFMIVQTEASADRAIAALQQAIQLDPDNVTVTSMLADMYFMMYQYGADQARLNEGIALANRALMLDPQCQHARFVMAFLPFYGGERDQFVGEMWEAIRLNPNAAWVLAVGGLQLGIVGEWEDARALMDKALHLNPHLPSYHHGLTFLDAYRQGQYAQALVAANRYNNPGLFWDPLIRAVALGQLDRDEEAASAVRDLFALKPDFLTTGRMLMKRTLFSDENVELLLRGLYKAGMQRVAG